MDLLLFGSGPLRELADDGQYISLVVTGLDHHEYGNRENDPVQDGIEREVPPRRQTYSRTNNPVHNQPGREQVESLKSVEADQVIILELTSREHNNGGDPAYCRNVTEDRGRPRRQPCQ